MSDIVISEFMDEAVIAASFAGCDLLYDPALVDRPSDLHAALADCRALIVRNRTQVRPELLDRAPSLKVVGRLAQESNVRVSSVIARAVLEALEA